MKAKKNFKRELVKSGALLLLAVVLLVSVVLAWFRGAEGATIESFDILMESGSDEVVVDYGATTNRTLVLPAVTKIEEVDASEFAKTIYVWNIIVRSAYAPGVVIKLDTVNGLHYYIDTEYNSSTDNALSYANIIKNNHTSDNGENDASKTFYYDENDLNADTLNNERPVAIVFWADYDVHANTILTNKSVNLNVLSKFDSTNMNG